MVIKNPPKISPVLIFGGGDYFGDDICVKNQGGGAYFRGGGGGGGGLLSGFYGILYIFFKVRFLKLCFSGLHRHLQNYKCY